MKRANEGRESQVWSQVVISFYFYFILFYFSVAKFCRLVDFVSFENAKNECLGGGGVLYQKI
jgi:hypothetical protein